MTKTPINDAILLMSIICIILWLIFEDEEFVYATSVMKLPPCAVQTPVAIGVGLLHLMKH